MAAKHRHRIRGALAGALLASVFSSAAQDDGTPRAPEPAGPGQDDQAPAVTSLERVEISASRKPERAGQTRMSGKELQRVPGAGSDPMKAVQSLPGVAVADDASSEPAIRGARPGDNAYYVDFLPVGYVFHVGGLTSVFHPDLVRNFDLYSAAFGPEYTDVISAVFDITLRNPRTDRFGALLDASFLGAGALVESPLGADTSVFFTVRRSYFDLFAKTFEDKDEGITVTLPVYSDYQGKLVWVLNPSHRLSLHLNGASDRVAFNLRGDSKIGRQDPVLAGNSNEKTSYNTFAAVLQSTLGERSTNRLALGRTVDRQFARIGSAGTIDLQTTNTYLREQLRFNLGEKHEVTLGGSVTRSENELDFDFNDPRCTEFDPNCDFSSAARTKTQQTITATFSDLHASDRWQFLPNWAASVGVRASRDDYLRRSYIEPRLGLEWSWSPRTLFSAGWGRHNQFPAGDQVVREIGNPALLRVRATHSVLGLSQKLAGDWSWRVEAYDKQFNNFAVADPRLNYVNGASGQSQGVELLVKKEPTSKLSGFLSLSASRAQRRNDQTGTTFAFDFDQPIIANLVLAYKPSEAWQYGLKWSFHTGSPYTPIVGTGTFPDGRVRPIYGPINSRRVPNYHRLDLRADRVFSPRWTGYLELINAYARKNVAGYQYSADYSTRESVYQLPALISFGVQYKL
jgi:hypothetical protein